MLDINLFRTGGLLRGFLHRSLLVLTCMLLAALYADRGGDPELVRESQRRRFADVSLVDQVIALDLEWRTVRYDLDQLLKESNAISKEVGQIKKVMSTQSLHARMAPLLP